MENVERRRLCRKPLNGYKVYECPEQMELRRLAAAKDLQAGMKPAEVACKYGVSRASVCRWNKTLRVKGLKEVEAEESKRARAQAHA